MINNTHTEIIATDNFTAIISGVPDECNHDWNGPTYYVTASGKFINYRTHLKWASYTDQYRRNLIHKHYHEKGDPIIEGGTTCSKCNKPFSPSPF